MGEVVTIEMVNQAEQLLNKHFNGNKIFNRKGGNLFFIIQRNKLNNDDLHFSVDISKEFPNSLI